MWTMPSCIFQRRRSLFFDHAHEVEHLPILFATKQWHDIIYRLLYVCIPFLWPSSGFLSWLEEERTSSNSACCTLLSSYHHPSKHRIPHNVECRLSARHLLFPREMNLQMKIPVEDLDLSSSCKCSFCNIPNLEYSSNPSKTPTKYAQMIYNNPKMTNNTGTTYNNVNRKYKQILKKCSVKC